MNMLRLGHPGVEFLTTGALTLPVPGDLGDHLRQVRRDVAFEEIIAEVETLEAEVLEVLDGRSPLPYQPNRGRANGD